MVLEVDVWKTQLRLSLEMLASALSFMASPYMAEAVKQFCADPEFCDTLRKVSKAVQAVENTCFGTSRPDLVRKLLDEVRRCPNVDCVKTVADEYEEMLGT